MERAKMACSWREADCGVCFALGDGDMSRNHETKRQAIHARKFFCLRSRKIYETRAGVSICMQLVTLAADLILLSARHRALFCKPKHIYENFECGFIIFSSSTPAKCFHS
jgi:hypothetical protein